MTSAELIRTFRYKLDKLDTAAMPDLTEGQVLWLLNEAQYRWVSQRYTGYVEPGGFETTQGRIDDLRTLVREHQYGPSTANGGTHSFSISSITDYAHTLRISALWEEPDCGEVSSSPLIVQHDDLSPALSNPFKRPDRKRRRTVALFRGTNLVVYAPWDLTGLTLQYLGVPSDIDAELTSELPDWVHRELVDEAVSIALEMLESPRQNPHFNQIARQE